MREPDFTKQNALRLLRVYIPYVSAKVDLEQSIYTASSIGVTGLVFVVVLGWWWGWILIGLGVAAGWRVYIGSTMVRYREARERFERVKEKIDEED